MYIYPLYINKTKSNQTKPNQTKANQSKPKQANLLFCFLLPFWHCSHCRFFLCRLRGMHDHSCAVLAGTFLLQKQAALSLMRFVTVSTVCDGFDGFISIIYL